jgi:hypothetical protein
VPVDGAYFLLSEGRMRLPWGNCGRDADRAKVQFFSPCSSGGPAFSRNSPPGSCGRDRGGLREELIRHRNLLPDDRSSKRTTGPGPSRCTVGPVQDRTRGQKIRLPEGQQKPVQMLKALIALGGGT